MSTYGQFCPVAKAMEVLDGFQGGTGNVRGQDDVCHDAWAPPGLIAGRV